MEESGLRNVGDPNPRTDEHKNRVQDFIPLTFHQGSIYRVFESLRVAGIYWSVNVMDRATKPRGLNRCRWTPRALALRRVCRFAISSLDLFL
jgi:hypothetical protein